ncbi:MAG: S-layer homology domain-containing protein [Syntrophomonadaceae bacterium]|nr:S-layer homology domain-containing protein [Syntrophomonadaceae bacterium]
MKTKLRGNSLVFTIALVISLLMSLAMPGIIQAESPYDQLAASALEKNHSLHQAGKAVDAGWGNFGSYDAYILKQAGVDLESWLYGESSFKSSVIDLIDATIAAEAGDGQKTAQRVAQDYLAAKSLGETEKAQQLLGILQARQLASGNGAFDSSTFSNMAAFEMLGRAGDIDKIDQAGAINYILGKQESGAWPPADEYGPDLMATAQAVRALKYLDSQGTQETVSTAISSGCDWLKSKQKDDGSFMGSDWDDPVIDTAEAINTQILLGIDPGTWITGGKTAIDYLKTAESYENVSSNTWALDAYLKLGASIVVADPNPSSYDQLAASALEKNHSLYQAGKVVDAGWGNFGSYDAYILKQAGVDLETWLYGESSFKSNVTDLIDATIAAEAGDGQKTAQRVAQDYLAAKSLGETDKAQQLLGILQARQLASGNGAFDSSTFSNMAAFELLGRTGDIDKIDQAGAINYILGKQESGAWPPADEYGPDFMATAQAVRALKYLDSQGTQETVNNAIISGCDWLKSKQKDDGSFMGSDWDDPVMDTAEAINTQILLGIDPGTWITGGKTAIDYLKTAESYENVSSNTWALDAYLKMGASIVVVNPNPGSGGGGDSQAGDNISVFLQVLGKNNTSLFGPGQITLSPSSPYGLTALGALNASSLSWAFSTQFDTLVEVIAGQRNEGMSGWMYKINNSVPMVPARDAAVAQGDSVLWWYSTDASSSGPSGTATILANTGLSQKEQEIKTGLSEYKIDFEQLGKGSSLKNLEQRMVPAQVQALQKELDANKVTLQDKEAGTAEAIIYDTIQEVVLYIPANALNETKKLSVQELTPALQSQPYVVKLASPVYEFGPSGTMFAEPVTVSLKVAITEDMDIKNLTPAWYDENKGEWIAVPGVIDLKAGLAVFQVEHFTEFALIEMPSRISFEDVDEKLAEYKDAIEILAGQGIVKGTGQGFEPQKHINRAEFVQLVVQALGLEQEQQTFYKDVKKSDWFARAVGIASNNDILAGYPDNTFRPGQKISRYEIASIINKLKGNADDNVATTALSYKDQEKIPAWALNGVKYLKCYELMAVWEGEEFKGESPVSRAEAALLIFKYLDLR